MRGLLRMGLWGEVSLDWVGRVVVWLWMMWVCSGRMG
jgi:hypothetical protein